VRVFVSEIPDEGLTLQFRGNESSWEGLEGIHLESFPRGQLFLEKRGQDVFLRGQFDSSARLSCSRCLEGYPFPVDVSFRYTLRPLDKDLRKNREMELVREDLEYGYYEGDVIQLDRLIEEHLLLTLPMKPLRRDDCRGICSRCGTNRNETDCGCSTTLEGNPFEVLKKKIS